MSTNKTTHYQLHSWHPDDEFHVAEINENFDKLDASARVMYGSYEGTGHLNTQTITVGVYPETVVVFSDGGSGSGNSRSAMTTRGFTVRGGSLVLTSTGFRVTFGDNSANLNDGNTKYVYAVFY